MATISLGFTRVVVAVALAGGLGSATVAAMHLLSVDDEIRLGEEAQREVRRALREVRDPEVRAYVSSLGQSLTRHAGGAAYPYSFSVADYRDLNAFALPGGPVWINRGVLEAAETEAQIAGVLAHEIAHVAHRHTARQLTKQMWTSGAVMVVGLIAGNPYDWRSQAVQTGAMVAAGGVLLKFSRGDERAADREGVRLLEQAGYDARGLVEFMALLDAQETRSPNAVARFFATHPAPADRRRELEARVGDSVGRRESPEFMRLKHRLALLPPAPSMPR